MVGLDDCGAVSLKPCTRKHNGSRAALVLWILLLLLFASVLMESAFAVAGVIMLSVPAIHKNPVTGLALYIATSTSGAFFPFSEGISLSRIYGLLYVISVLLKAFSRPRRLRLKLEAVWFAILLVIINTLSLLYSLSLESTWAGNITMGLNIVIFLITVGYRWDDNETIHMLSICIRTVLVFFTLYLVTGHGIIDLRSGRWSLSSAVNANAIAISLAQLSIVCIAAVISAKEPKRKLTWGLLVAAGTLMLFMTGSRSSLFGLIMGLVFILFSVDNYRRWQKGILFAALFGGLCLIWTLLGKLAPSLMGRFSIEAILRGQGTGRLVIWSNLARYVIPQHLWFGVGLGGGNVIASLTHVDTLYHKPAHNIVIDLITQLGVVGILVYGSFFVLTYRCAKRVPFEHSLVFAFAAMFVVSIGIGIGETMFFNKLLWVSAAMCWKYAGQPQDRAHTSSREEWESG